MGPDVRRGDIELDSVSLPRRPPALYEAARSESKGIVSELEVRGCPAGTSPDTAEWLSRTLPLNDKVPAVGKYIID